MLSGFARGTVTIIGALIRGDGLVLGRFEPDLWPAAIPVHTKKNTPVPHTLRTVSSILTGIPQQIPVQNYLILDDVFPGTRWYIFKCSFELYSALSHPVADRESCCSQTKIALRLMILGNRPSGFRHNRTTIGLGIYEFNSTPYLLHLTGALRAVSFFPISHAVLLGIS